MLKTKIQLGLNALEAGLNDENYDKTFILCDTNTLKSCLPLLPKSICANAYIITIESGDQNKTLGTAESIWTNLIEEKATRHSVLINLGGGMVTDIGGFAAATFKRGMNFINVPTTLLGAVDASIGGKTGVNFKNIKNQIGSFSEATGVFVDTVFFDTLSLREYNSGLAEVVKYGLIWDADLFLKVQVGTGKDDLQYFVERSISIKQEITEEDPFESGIRQLLNFGHTIGHALETYSYSTKHPLKHGEAVALGMIAESFLSHYKLGFDQLDVVTESIMNRFQVPNWLLELDDFEPIIDLMTHDKKNVGMEIRCSLLRRIGSGDFGFSLTTEEN